jgi:hypothetical protein
MNFADFRKRREQQAKSRVVKERRPAMTTHEERLLYSLRLKTVEYRTLMTALKEELRREQLDHILVEYNLRLRKAKNNFNDNNYKYEWELEDEQ